MSRDVDSDLVMEIFDRLFALYGPQHWWPGDTPLEIAVGAILTQNTSWTNVEKAIGNIKAGKLMDEQRLFQLPDGEMAALIRPSGYFNVKTRRLKNFLRVLVERYDGGIENFLNSRSSSAIREELLEINGIGPETADSILLYAGNFPVFVVDKYTQRIFSRHGLIPPDCTYDEMQSFFIESLKEDCGLFNEYHALIVRLGKERCVKKPKCGGCPLHGAGLEGYES